MLRGKGFLVGITGALIGLLTFLALLGFYGDITGFLWAPNGEDRLVAHLESLVGPVVLVEPPGHDGQFFFLQANDPWLLNPGVGLEFLDSPTYRAQRMLYPALAGIGGLLSPPQILWGLVLTNILATGAGAWGLARMATSMGMSRWLGLAFALNPGIMFEMAIDASSILGWALAVWGLVMVQHHKWIPGAALFSAAVLARETMAVLAIGAFAYVWFAEGRRGQKLIVAVVAAPGLAGGLWWLWVRRQLDTLATPSGSEALAIPGKGLWLGVSNWLSTGGLNLALGVLVIFCVLLVAASAVSRPSLLAWATAGFIPLLLVLHPAATVGGLNFTRVMAPIVSAALVLVFGRKAFVERAQTQAA